MPSPELAKAMPESKAAWAMASRAGRDWPLWTASAIAGIAFLRPSMARACGIGCAFFEMKLSMSCVIASMPLAAVTAGGTVTVSSGSTRAMRGMIFSERRLFLKGGS